MTKPTETETRSTDSDTMENQVASAVSTDFIETLRAAKAGTLSGAALARLIDHTFLKADATKQDVERVCAEAREHGFASVCVNSSRVEQAAKALEGTSVLPIAVVGFPLGAMCTDAKADETRRAVSLGAREIDMVLAIGALKDGDHVAVETDIRAVVEAATSRVPVKAILETAYLSRDEIVTACRLAKRAGAAFVKTSTGFATPTSGRPTGATSEAVSLMRVTVGPTMGVKASGGIRSREDALRMIAAGANRIGASSSVAIVTAKADTSDGY